jgi:general secretion pathway protein E
MNSSPRTALPIGRLLVDCGRISAADLERALEVQAQSRGRLGAILVRLGALSEESLYPVLAEQTGFGVVRAGELDEAALLAALQALGLDAVWARQQRALLWQDGSGAWCAAADDPLLPEKQEAVARAVQGAVRWHLMLPAEFEQLLAALGRSGAVDALDAAALRELAEDAPIVQLVNSIMAQAIDERASDIHVEPGERRALVRFRIDGVLHERMEIGGERYPATVSRIKLIAGLDIAERRLPQDGRVSVRLSGLDMDLRVSVIPAVHGESIVMRLLPKQRADLGLPKLGFDAAQEQQVRGWLRLPNGIVLVTGPTGSGKSTTLYSVLEVANTHGRKIVTVEDPVEHKLPGIIQIQAHADIGYGFARALRAILRHDPDIIMIGEIRDAETAQIAIQAALTGHLVFATLHTNDALSAFTRLVDMGVEPYLVAAACQAVLAQRLVRRLCPHCNAPQAAPPVTLPRDFSEPANWRAARGCNECGGTGYRGRLGVYELVSVAPELRHAIASSAPFAEWRALAGGQARSSLRDDGVRKAARGVTAWDEVLRVLGDAGAQDA